MKIGFSSIGCPSWDLDTILEKATAYGYEGVELRGLNGELDLRRVPALTADPQRVRRRLEGAGIELVCLGTGATLDGLNRKVLARNREELLGYIDLAAELACPYVRLFIGETQKGEDRRETLSRVAEQLAGVADYAGERKVSMLLENGGDFPGSGDLWFVCDWVSHPAVGACWNPCSARLIGERPTISVPRLGTRIGLVHVCDGSFDEEGFFEAYRVPGEGDVEIGRLIDLLRGVMFRDFLVFDWPALWDASLAAADVVLPKAAAFLRAEVDRREKVLTAYKGDKHPTKLATPPEQSFSRSV